MKRIAYIYISVLYLVMVSSCMKTKIANEPTLNNEISSQNTDNATVTDGVSVGEPASNNEISNQNMDTATVADGQSVNEPALNDEISNQDMDTEGEWAGFGIPQNILSFQPDTSPLPDVKPWLEKANAGNDEAQFVMSMLYRDGVMGVDNIVNGKPSVKKANRLHEMYRWILREDEDEYEDEESVFMGISLNPSLTDDPEDYHGVHKYDNNESCAAQAESLKLLENIANHGYSNAEFVLGLIYWNGVCVPKDKARGADLIQRATMHDRKNVNAAYYVGMMHELGIGRKVNKKLANAWLELAADNGSVEAQFVMALKYLDGIDVAPDKQKADHYMNMSLVCGDGVKRINKDYHPWITLLADYFGLFGYLCDTVYGYVVMHYQYREGTIEDYYYDGLSEYEAQFDDSAKDEELFEIFKRVKKPFKYAIDYDLAKNWLVEVASGNNNHAMILYAMVIEEYYEYLSDDAPLSFLNNVLANRFPHAHRYLANYYYESGYRSDYKFGERQRVIDELNQSLTDWDFQTFQTDNEKRAFILNTYSLLTTYCDDSKQMICAKYAISYANTVEQEYYNAVKENRAPSYEIVNDWEKASTLAADRLENAASYARSIADAFYNAANEAENTPDKKCNMKDYLNESKMISKIDPDPIYKVDKDCYVNALKWYERTVQLSKRAHQIDSAYGKDGRTDGRTHYNLGKLYSDPNSTIKDTEKAVRHFTTSLELWHYDIVNGCFNCGFMTNKTASYVIDYYYDKLNNIEKLDESYVALSFLYHVNKNTLFEWNKNLKAVWEKISAYINTMERIDGLQNAVLDEIKKEEGKSLQEFYIINSGLTPCVDSRKNKYSCQYLNDTYNESVTKAMRGITALCIAQKGKADPRLIKNTYYSLGVMANIDPINVAQFIQWSPVASEILNNRIIHDDDRKKLYYSWYLRQIPYAAKALYKATCKSGKSWNSLLKEANKAIEASDDMKRAFGIDLFAITPAYHSPEHK